VFYYSHVFPGWEQFRWGKFHNVKMLLHASDFTDKTFFWKDAKAIVGVLSRR
jgi:hypothetical protein